MFDHNSNIPKDRPLVQKEDSKGSTYTDHPLEDDRDRQDSLWNHLLKEAAIKSGGKIGNKKDEDIY